MGVSIKTKSSAILSTPFHEWPGVGQRERLGGKHSLESGKSEVWGSCGVQLDDAQVEMSHLSLQCHFQLRYWPKVAFRALYHSLVYLEHKKRKKFIRFMPYKRKLIRFIYQRSAQLTFSPSMTGWATAKYKCKNKWINRKLIKRNTNENMDKSKICIKDFLITWYL